MKYLKATKAVPFMGLNNKSCSDPVYWCRCHEVWLSEEDVEKKGCKHKMDFDMISTHKCGSLERKGIKL